MVNGQGAEQGPRHCAECTVGNWLTVLNFPITKYDYNERGSTSVALAEIDTQVANGSEVSSFGSLTSALQGLLFLFTRYVIYFNSSLDKCKSALHCPTLQS